MPAELQPDLELQIAHLLLIDVVGYSKLLVNEQIELLQRLNRIVRATACFRAAEAKDKLIRLPTGDGMALLFFDSLEQPVRCACEIGAALKDHPEIRVRMGIHSGPVNQVTDVNDRVNVAGAGINIAQRVLDCGDAGHILVSKHVADDLAQYRHWSSCLHDLGECEVKHGLRLHVFNLCKDGVGNPQVPEKLSRRIRWKKPSGPVHPVSSPRRRIWMAASAVAFVAVVIALWAVWRQYRVSRPITAEQPAATIPEKSIAVMPFANLSDDKQNAYFADGVQDEILTNLSRVADLKVISRTSVMQYKDVVKHNVREIARQLGVAHILEGSVQRVGSRVRLTTQLIDARSDNHVWAEHYDRDLADVFAIENELSEQIVAQLKLRLSATEKAAIEQKPTSNLGAYELYTRAKILIERSVFNEPQGNLSEAVSLLEQAVKADPSFVLAYYQLAQAYDQIYLRYDHTPARLVQAEAAVTTVARLQPASPEAHLAQAKHVYWAYRDYDRARQEIDAARRLLPNDAFSFLLLGYIDRRQGRWDESIRNMQHAIELDPQNAFFFNQFALTFEVLRRYDEAGRLIDQGLKLSPNDFPQRVRRAGLDFSARGDSRAWHDVLRDFTKDAPDVTAAVAESRVTLALYERNMAEARNVLRGVSPDAWLEIDDLNFPRAFIDGVVARLGGDEIAAMKNFKAAREQLVKATRDQPEHAELLAALAVVDAAIGNKREAIAEGQRAADLLPVSKDKIDGVALLHALALIYAINGDVDHGIEQLQVVAQMPGYLSYGRLKYDPFYQPLRRDPRFDKILASLGPR